MELSTSKQIRQNYIEVLSQDPSYNEITETLINKPLKEPISNFKYVNDEDEPSFSNEQREFSEIMLDINSVNYSLIEISNKLTELLNTINENIFNAESTIEKQEDHIQDLNILCGQDSEYNMIIPIYESYFPNIASEYIDEKTFCANKKSLSLIGYSINNVSGNGISGNKYVYNDEQFEEEIEDRSLLKYIYDDSDVTSFEYSRYFTNKKNEAIDGIINYDDKDVECILTIESESKVCIMKFLSEDSGIIVKNVEISKNGIDFTSCLSKELMINNRSHMYDNEYVYGSGIICFPYTKYIRLTLSSSSILDDNIAIKSNDEVMEYKNTRRKRVKINNIKLYSGEYSDGTIISDNLLKSGSVDKVGLFVNEYIPEHFSDQSYIKYSLIVNGTEYEITPVNSQKNGIKLIKFSEKNEINAQDYTTCVSETIKDIKIKISISPYQNDETPYISNMKLCLGKDTGSIYV